MPQSMYQEWDDSLRADGWMTIDELAQYHEEYRNWLDMTSCNYDDTLVFFDQMA